MLTFLDDGHMYNVIYEQAVKVLGRDNVLQNSSIVNIVYRVTEYR